MIRNSCLFLFVFFHVLALSQATFDVEGKVIANVGRMPLSGVLVQLKGTTLEQETEADGTFVFTAVPPGTYTLHLERTGYHTMTLPIVVDADLDMGYIPLKRDLVQELTNSITLTENDLNADEYTVETTSILLRASRDVFSGIAAFEFGQTFFRPRGLDSENATVLINGIAMNTLFNGRPQWNNWGGLNDITRNQEFSPGLSPSDYHFGGLLGTTHISTRASDYSSRLRISASSSNRSYAGRLMATYSSGLRNKTLAYTIAASRRWAAEGFVEGTLYDAYSLFGAFEYRLHKDHSLNFSAVYTPVRSGRSAPNTQEIFDLKGSRYNPYWGYQEGRKRNSRIRRIRKPLFMLSHYWTINSKSKLMTTIACQTGKVGNSRLDFGGRTAITTPTGNSYYSGGAPNPDPAYYQKLPSFFLSFNDAVNYKEAHNRRKAFVRDGQLHWDALYAANLNNAAHGRNAAYLLYEDRNDNTQFAAATVFNTNVSEHVALTATLNHRHLKSGNFASVLDMLGGTGYLDIDPFAKTPSSAPNDLRQPDRIVQEGDRFKYNYNMYAGITDGFAQAKFRYNTIDFYVAATLGTATYQREGLYQNGLFPDTSLGRGKKLSYTDFGGKAGLTYKLTGRHFIQINAAYIQDAPTLRNVFVNPRQHHATVKNSTTQKTKALDISYIIRSSVLKSRLTGYYNATSDATSISSFFVDGLKGETSSFVQEVLAGIEKRNIGMEFGMEAHVTPTITLKAAAAIGAFIYNNNPDLYLTSDDLDADFPMLKSNLKNYNIPGGPQQAFSLGFVYRDPDFWWVGAAVNYFSNAYVAINPLRRTANFYSDAYGFPFPEYDENLARTLLRQEKLDDYHLLNLVGGKSWSIQRKYYISVFASINNVLNQLYKTGGFEHARNGNYRTLLEEHQNEVPVFGSRYWYGRGASYFINVALSL